MHMKINRLVSSLRLLLLTAATGAFISSTALAAADSAPLPFVSPMFGDNMVLQRGKPNTIWGWAKPGQEIRVTIADKSATAVTKDDGRWSVAIQPPAPGGPYTMVIDGPQHVEFRDVLVGDVWLCGGQSNMEMALGQARNGSEEIKAADHPRIRFFIVRQHVAYVPTAVPQGSWKICSPKTVAEGWGGFSAVAYFFGRRLQQEIDVPIGLVQDCVGGTPAESWTSAGTLRSLKDFDAALDEVARLQAKGAPQYGNFISHWYDEYDRGQKDNAWFRPNLDDTDWKPVTIPGGFRELGVPESPALCYFRKRIVLPDPVLSENPSLHLFKPPRGNSNAGFHPGACGI
jgi:sialate O-acetylesterase